MSIKLPTRKPGSHSRGYNRDGFKEYINQHLLAFVKRGAKIHENGKDYFPITITAEMVGHYLGEFSLTRKNVSHSAAGVGATRSSKAVSAR